MRGVTRVACAIFYGLWGLSPDRALADAGRGIQIWFRPMTWNIKPSGEGIEYKQHDFSALMAPNAPWALAKSRISVLSLPGNVVWSYPDLQQLVAFTNGNHIPLAFGRGMLFNGGRCGVGAEGMSSDPDFNRETAKIAEIWEQAGGRLDYLVMDSPLFFGHYASGCRYSIRESAHRAAITFRQVKKYFPKIQVIDAEGPGRTADRQWLPDIGEFLTDFDLEAGTSVAAVALDLHWRDLRPGSTWIKTARHSVAFFHSRGVKAGLFIDADATKENTSSDRSWMDESRSHLTQTASEHLALDFISIESWVNVPKRNLPEDNSEALTSLVNLAYSLFEIEKRSSSVSK